MIAAVVAATRPAAARQRGDIIGLSVLV